jgi:hypothetical protein
MRMTASYKSVGETDLVMSSFQTFLLTLTPLKRERTVIPQCQNQREGTVIPQCHILSRHDVLVTSASSACFTVFTKKNNF